jgi:hypothetical protein
MTLWALLSILHVAPVRATVTVAAVQQVLIIAHLSFVPAEVRWFFEVCQHDGLFEVLHSEPLWSFVEARSDCATVDGDSGFFASVIVADLYDVHMQQHTHAPMLTLLTVPSTVDVC